MTLRILGSTKLLGVFGYPIEHSLSPLMHNAALEELKLNYCYIPFKVEPKKLGGAVGAIRALNIRGVNVTIPHKVAVMEYLDEISLEAEIIGAVNTICNDEGILKGYNTDGKGFVRSLKEDACEDPSGKKMLLIGAGGAAKGVAVQLGLEGVGQLTIANRTPEKAENLARLVNKAVDENVAVPSSLGSKDFIRAMNEADIIINATPIGMYPYIDDSPLQDENLINSETLVCDLIYNPLETVLLRTAKTRGARTLNGIGMLAYQGAIAFNIWTGALPPVHVMKKTLVNALTPIKY